MCDDLVGTGEQHRTTGASGKTGEEPSQQRRGIYSGGKASENKFTMKYREKRFFFRVRGFINIFITVSFDGGSGGG